MRLIYIAFTCLVFGLISCNNNGNTTNTGNGTTTPVTPPKPVYSKLGHEDTQKLMDIVNQYYALKNALVAAKASRADTAAAQLELVARNFATSFSLKDSASGDAIKLYIDTIINQSEIVHNIKDETCEKQRLAFGTISGNVYKLLKSAELKNAHIYHEYCPMAFNEKGASWLSDESEIKNPYFGKKMMECGEVTDSL